MVTSIIPLFTEMNQELKIRNLWQIDRGGGGGGKYWGKMDGEGIGVRGTSGS